MPADLSYSLEPETNLSDSPESPCGQCELGRVSLRFVVLVVIITEIEKPEIFYHEQATHLFSVGSGCSSPDWRAF